MDDETLIARLREPSTLQVYCHQAADRIEALSLEVERLRGAVMANATAQTWSDVSLRNPDN